ncbi:MAG: tetratricopeptide repeat protein, partial [bacterium]|nr:tetratricopeptide repeat protein [bacterium]
ASGTKHARYDTPEHHFHAAGSAGAQCVNCHMPAKTYMVIDDRRDHSFRIPRPHLSLQLGTPDACTGCHVGRTVGWAADAVTKWYGTKTTPHYANSLAAGRAGRTGAVAGLSRLATASEQPAIVRATALELLRPYGTAGASAIVTALQEANPLLRVTAVGSLEGFPPRSRLEAAAPLLHDPIRAVRMEAARVLSAIPADAFSSTQRQDFEAALSEYTALQRAMADTPGAHLNLAVVEANQGQFASAEQSYQTALRLDRAFLPARFNLATLYNRMGRNTDAERILREALRHAPEEGELYYSLGLLLAEEKRLADAVDAVRQATEVLPERARVQYNYGLTLQHLGRRSEAEAALLKAYQLEPEDARVLQALAVFYIQAQQWGPAATYAEQLVRLYPNTPGPQRLLRQIRAQQRRR